MIQKLIHGWNNHINSFELLKKKSAAHLDSSCTYYNCFLLRDLVKYLHFFCTWGQIFLLVVGVVVVDKHNITISILILQQSFHQSLYVGYQSYGVCVRAGDMTGVGTCDLPRRFRLFCFILRFTIWSLRQNILLLHSISRFSILHLG